MKTSAMVIGVLVIGLGFASLSLVRGETFGQNAVVNASLEQDRNVPAIAVGWDGTVYATWQDKASGEWRIMLAHSAASGGSFSGHVRVASSPPPRTIETVPDIGYWNQTVYVVWQDNRSAGSNDIYFASVPMPDNIPSAEKKINGEAWPGQRTAPAMAVGPNGSMYVSYVNESLQVRLTASYDGGATWTPSALVSNSMVNTRGEQRVAVDPRGNVYVVWRDGRSGMINRPGGVQVEDDDVYIANSTDGGRTFGENTPVNDVVVDKVQSSPSIAVDGHGRIHVAWKDERLESNEETDIFYAHSDDGRYFSRNMPVNDTAPVQMTPRRTNHQQPWIAADPTGSIIYISWSDDRGIANRGGFHNIYIVKSVDGGTTFHTASELGSGANVFIDDNWTCDGVWESSEAAIKDDGNRTLDPGRLNGNPDLVVSAGKANLIRELAGDYLRYHDANSNGSWEQDEDIVLNGPSGVFPGILPSALTPWNTAGPGLSPLYYTEGIAMNVSRWELLGVDGFNTDGAGLTPGDPIADAYLELVYRANGTYTGSNAVQWQLEGGFNTSWFVPTNTNDVWTLATLSLVPLGVTTVPELTTMNVSFVNNGAGEIFFDKIGLNVTRGRPDAFDKLDTVVYNGTAATGLGNPLANFTIDDKLVFIDVDLSGHYDRGEALIHTSAIVASNGTLSSADEVLRRGDGPSWKVFLTPFPINNNVGGSDHFMPRIALNPFNYVNAIWQDYRDPPWPDIYASAAPTSEVYGPYMAFWMDTSQMKAGAGGLVAYNIHVRNIGNVSAAMVNVSNRLPPGLDFVQSNPVPNQVIGRELRWQTPFLSAVGYWKIVVVARVNSSVPLNTILQTNATLRFTDLLDNPRPDMYSWLSFISSDLVPPKIVHTQPRTEIPAGTSLYLNATVTDEFGVSVVRLYIKPVGAIYFNAPLQMSRSGLTDEYTITFEIGTSAGTLEYYIEAVDTNANVGRSPAGAPSQAYVVKVVGGGEGFPIVAVAAVATVLLVGVILVAIFMMLRKRKPEEAVEEKPKEEMTEQERKEETKEEHKEEEKPPAT